MGDPDEYGGIPPEEDGPPGHADDYYGDDGFEDAGFGGNGPGQNWGWRGGRGFRGGHPRFMRGGHPPPRNQFGPPHEMRMRGRGNFGPPPNNGFGQRGQRPRGPPPLFSDFGPPGNLMQFH